MSNLTTLERIFLAPLLRVHDSLYRKTDGRIGHHVPGMPDSLLLHTIGAKSGQQRSSTLTYAKDGESYLVVASYGGSDSAPGWYHNLRKRPECEINVGPQRFGVTARSIGPDDPDYARLWQIVNKNNANRYEGYQSRTSRPIPIVALTPTK
ncbi:MAG: nitroreductase family deazaflavin-dependent oxidoreductase [Actinomycetota bacterium]|uniref:Nitroreductase family deazaflavin-dependent oxidoreductase n=1 Tax=Mycobacterium lentiflavum TaxID=141349 RepID=A0ABY3UVH9_MYCLN|nr:nitroreductase family deazaflavin-dependent oxidoreductase [Mycobacterium lentiflavum]MEE3067487.1 nitroreductase family deazaflavin-dependent oxidoreductase [Actinomycetota bacterium]ULP41254.1 nitroreductase family deazaflavin-dependent oxidoreductase [Mycobacterium lentiflavum]